MSNIFVPADQTSKRRAEICEETAYFLDLTVNSDKPIVLIGAQRNASEKDFDGPRNLLNATRICVSPDARGKGAMIVLNNQINAAREVTKTHT